MDYYERKHIVDTTNDGNHINQPPEGFEDVQESEECENCDECGKGLTYQDWYRDGGLCWNCIERIGK